MAVGIVPEPNPASQPSRATMLNDLYLSMSTWPMLTVAFINGMININKFMTNNKSLLSTLMLTLAAVGLLPTARATPMPSLTSLNTIPESHQHCATDDPEFDDYGRRLSCPEGFRSMSEANPNCSTLVPPDASNCCKCENGTVMPVINSCGSCFNETTGSSSTVEPPDPTTVMDPCDSQPCLNDGLCAASSPSNYNCTCPENFIGVNCEAVMNPCDSQPCLNDGLCAALSPLEYNCTCPETFIGVNCETVMDPCDSQPCLNDGLCVALSPSDFNCTCPENFIGVNCEAVKHSCVADNPCANGATCAETIEGTIICRCAEGFTGDNCTEAQQSDLKTILITAPMITGACLLIIVLFGLIVFVVWSCSRKGRAATDPLTTDPAALPLNPGISSSEAGPEIEAV